MEIGRDGGVSQLQLVTVSGVEIGLISVERRIRHGMRMTHTKTLAAGLYKTSALPSLAASASGGPIGALACAVAYVRRTRGVIGRVGCGAIDGREMYITVVSSATWNSHTRAYMHSSQITEIQQEGAFMLVRPLRTCVVLDSIRDLDTKSELSVLLDEESRLSDFETELKTSPWSLDFLDIASSVKARISSPQVGKVRFGLPLF